MASSIPTEDNDAAAAPNSDATNQPQEDNAVEQPRQVQVVQQQQPPSSNNETTTASLPLDWTQQGQPQQQHQPPPIRYPSDVAEIAPDETEICIVGTAGQKITHMGNDFSSTIVQHPNLVTQLILRSHLIQNMQGLEQFTQLELLELYDNQVDSLEHLRSMSMGKTTIRTLDMSYNSIRDMQPVALCPNLQELYLANNKLKTMAGLGPLTQLKKLDLGANRIRVMEDLSGLVNLEELWLGKNKIESIQGLEPLVKLRRLDVQSNRLTDIQGLDTCAPILEELFLSHNAITNEGAQQGLQHLAFPELSVLDLSRNRLTSTAAFSHLTSLDELWLSGNKIGKYEDVACLKSLSSLDTIYLEYNPIADDPLYRKTIKELIPCLKQIDANLITSVAAVTGIPTPRMGGRTTEDMQQLQDMVVERAKEETTKAATTDDTTQK